MTRNAFCFPHKFCINYYKLFPSAIENNSYAKLCGENNKHLLTGPKGNSEFCFPETSMFPEAKPRGTLRLEGKQNSLFPEGPVIKCFVIPPNSKYRV